MWRVTLVHDRYFEEELPFVWCAFQCASSFREDEALAHLCVPVCLCMKRGQVM